MLLTRISSFFSTAAVAITLVLAPSCANAAASDQPGWFSRHTAAEQREVVDYSYIASGQAARPYAAEAVAAQDLFEHLGTAGAVDSGNLNQADLARQQVGSLRGVGLLSEVSGVIPYARALATIPGVVGAAALIGGNFLAYRSLKPVTIGGEFRYTEIYWVPSTQEIYNGVKPPAPGRYVYEGWIGSNQYRPARWFDSPCPFSGYSPPQNAHFEQSAPSTAKCAYSIPFPPYLAYSTILVDYPYLDQSDLVPMGTLRKYNYDRDSKLGLDTGARSIPPDPGAALVATRIASDLDGDDRGVIRAEIEWLLTPGRQPEEEPVGDTAYSSDVAVQRRRHNGCETSDPEGAAGDAGAYSPNHEYAPGEGPEEHIEETFSVAYDASGGSATSVPLRWGNEGFGLRHIRIGHGWGPDDRSLTAAALATPDNVILDEDNDMSWNYFKYYELPDGTECERKVVVSFRIDTRFPTEPRGIITSYSQPRGRS